MTRFDRQTLIEGWEQERLTSESVVVCGRDWLGTFAVWGLASLGVGEILWLGSPNERTRRFTDRMLHRPSFFTDTGVYDYPFDPERVIELLWVGEQRRPRVVVDCSDDGPVHHILAEAAKALGAAFLAASARSTGRYGIDPVPSPVNGIAQEPVAAMALAAVLIDSVRETLCPLSGGFLPDASDLRWFTPQPGNGALLLIGSGGIGVYAATLTAILGIDLIVVDFDRVEETNLNRQGLFTPEHASGGHFKSVATEETLKTLVPGANVNSVVARAGLDFEIEVDGTRPAVMLSAVDNAESRLVLQSLGQKAKLPIVQAGTGQFAADCYVQTVGGVSLNGQMRGALTKAAARESQEGREGSCQTNPSYVVPSMMAGAMMAHRACQLTDGGDAMAPLLWRSGNLPIESRR